MYDPIVAEVRKAREEFARQFNYDLHAMCEELRREQRLNGAKVVSFPPRPPQVFLVKSDAEAEKAAVVNDPISAEVHKAREEFARQFNYDLHAMCEELRREEKLSGGGPLVSRPKRPAQTFPAKRAKETTAPAS